MTRLTEHIDDYLHAFIDGEADDGVRASVEAALASDPELAGLAEQYRADKARIADVYGDLNEPLPERWISMIEGGTRRAYWRQVALPAMAIAASLVLVFGLTIAFQQSATPAKSDIVAEALAARTNEIGPGAVISVRSDMEAKRQGSVMARALATRVKAPDLSRLGYRLVGIQAYDSPARSFELVYRDRSARIFTLYLRRSSGAPRFDQFVENGLRVCVWQDDVVGTVMAGKMSAPEMQRLASLAYVGLTL
jgi:anti-sigma factor RsiW